MFSSPTATHKGVALPAIAEGNCPRSATPLWVARAAYKNQEITDVRLSHFIYLSHCDA